MTSPTPSTPDLAVSVASEQDTVTHNGKDIMQIWFECNRDVFTFYDRITAPTTGSAPLSNHERIELYELRASVDAQETMLSGERGLKELWKERASVWCLAANERAASADEIFVTLCDLLGQVQAFIDQYGEADFETGRAKQVIANRNALLAASTGGDKL